MEEKNRDSKNLMDMFFFVVLTILSILVVAVDLYAITVDLGIKLEGPSEGWSDILKTSLEGWEAFVLTANIFAIFHIFITFILTFLQKISNTIINTLVMAYFVLNIVTFSVFYGNQQSFLDKTYPEPVREYVSITLKGALVTQLVCISFSFLYLVWALYIIFNK